MPLKNHSEVLQRGRRPRQALRGANKRRLALLFGAVLLLVAIAAFFGFLLIQDMVASGEVFPGITIDGQKVEGLSREDAARIIDEKVKAPLSGALVLYHGDKEVELEPRSVGLTVDTRKMVDTAYWAGRSPNVFSRMFRRLLHKPMNLDVPVLAKYDTKKLMAFVVGVAREMDYPPTSSSIDVSEGYPIINPSRDGLQVKQQETINVLSGALSKHERKVPVPTVAVKPELTESDIGKIIVIGKKEHTLYLYDKEDLINSYVIAVGMPQYPTPNGKFHVTYKEKNPTWLPTSEWARDKQGIPQPPGPDNPLGGYWMDIGGGLGIHATPYEGTLGEDASHGCIRMAPWAAEEVFNYVKVGTPVYIMD
ncbi:MAG: L,D-transpeptidase/peptidoglycan binding protein [Actinobacteria bacterium]|nr:L,D-transpeptidase/peptidoglycan binding protein [Actinomycetota bacterium]